MTCTFAQAIRRHKFLTGSVRATINNTCTCTKFKKIRHGSIYAKIDNFELVFSIFSRSSKQNKKTQSVLCHPGLKDIVFGKKHQEISPTPFFSCFFFNIHNTLCLFIYLRNLFRFEFFKLFGRQLYYTFNS